MQAGCCSASFPDSSLPHTTLPVAARARRVSHSPAAVRPEPHEQHKQSNSLSFARPVATSCWTRTNPAEPSNCLSPSLSHFLLDGKLKAEMETFKKHLIQSLNDDNTSTETVDIGTCDQSLTKTASLRDGGSSVLITLSSAAASTEKSNTIQDGKKFSSSYITPRFTPGTTPKVQSIVGSPKQFSTAASPKMTSGATSPSKSHAEGYTSVSPWCPSSKQSSAANSPPRDRSMPGRTRVDGKEFFRQAKNRLSYEQFSAFLANIKELNAHRQTREETSKKAEEIFGADNKDLYLSFQGLLYRNMP